MKRKSKRVAFDNGRGQQLVGIMDWPPAEPVAFGLFSHCFTCGKDLKAIVRISRRLVEHGFCMLRYDCTGLGESGGEFSDTNFSTTCQDLLAAASFLSRDFRGPNLLVGHSMGGSSTVATALEIETAKAAVTIASPGCTKRLAGFLSQANPEIETTGQGVVNIGGTDFLLKRQLLDDLREQDIQARMSELRLPILMFHSPADQILPYEMGLRMFEAARSPKSFVTLDGADHLLVGQGADVLFVADMIWTWSKRYLIAE